MEGIKGKNKGWSLRGKKASKKREIEGDYR